MADLLFEIGAEEIPASFIEPALADIRRIVTEKLTEARLAFGDVRTFGTPRRLAILVTGLADRSSDVTRDVLGPSVKAAFDPSGKPTKAAEKFAESVKLSVDKLARVQSPKGEYLGTTVVDPGKPAMEIVTAALHAAAHGIAFKKSMRWGDVDLSFARPVQWIVALLGSQVVPVTFADVASGRTSFGHRFLTPSPIVLGEPSEYEAGLETRNVVPDIAKRKALTLVRVRQAAERAGGKVLDDPSLLDQVTNLVELPNAVLGSFDARHLDLPPEVLIQEMKGHQRYFSVTDSAGKLLPHFVAVSNTPVRDERLSLRGYERVLKARLADGRFFFDEDRKTKLEARLPRLERVVFQQQLGTTAEKVARITALARWFAQATGNGPVERTVDRAAALCKADLVTGMVGEFPELQGVMGREYARHDGEPTEVALAIFEHYLPRTASDDMPSQIPGALIGLADRLDSLTGIFGIGKPPTGQADPFGLRRACIAIINVTLAKGLHFSLAGAVDEALRLLAPKLVDAKRKPGEPDVRTQVLEFFRGRLKVLFGETQRADVVESVLATGFDDIVIARERLVALGQMIGQPDFLLLAAAFRRAVNIVEKNGKDVVAGQVDPARFNEDAERKLHAAYVGARADVEAATARGDFAGALRRISQLKPSVDAFFESVMVIADDRATRENRVRLLMELRTLFSGIADFARIQVDGAT